MSIVQIFVYVAYAFGAIFLIGALVIIFNIFRKNEAKKSKVSKKETKIEAEKIRVEEAIGGSFFRNKERANVILPDSTSSEKTQLNIDEEKPSENKVQQLPQPVRQLKQPVRQPANTPVASQKGFAKPSFSQNNVELGKAAREDEFNLPY